MLARVITSGTKYSPVSGSLAEKTSSAVPFHDYDSSEEDGEVRGGSRGPSVPFFFLQRFIYFGVVLLVMRSIRLLGRSLLKLFNFHAGKQVCVIPSYGIYLSNGF